MHKLTTQCRGVVPSPNKHSTQIEQCPKTNGSEGTIFLGGNGQQMGCTRFDNESKKCHVPALHVEKELRELMGQESRPPDALAFDLLENAGYAEELAGRGMLPVLRGKGDTPEQMDEALASVMTNVKAGCVPCLLGRGFPMQ